MLEVGLGVCKPLMCGMQGMRMMLHKMEETI